MKRNVNLDDISDGRRYKVNDIAKTDCNGCRNCSICCKGMGNSIVLDPLDVHRLKKYLTKEFQDLLTSGVELNIVDGSILPNLKMGDEACSYLDESGRCSIHSARPEICRLFPLGRVYEEDDFDYFIQVHECPAEKSEIRIRKWIDTPELKRYEQYIMSWHLFLKEVETLLVQEPNEMNRKNMNLYLLNQFYIKGFNESLDFYLQFQQRLAEAKDYVISLNLSKSKYRF